MSMGQPKRDQYDNETQAYGYSSLGYTARNSDGTKRIHCFQCRQYISTVSGMLNFHGGICVNCQRINAGLDPLPTEVLPKTVYVEGRGDVPESTIFVNDATPDPLVGDTKGVPPANRVAFFRKVISAIKPKKQKEPESRAVAKEKKTKRLFADGIILNDNKEQK